MTPGHDNTPEQDYDPAPEMLMRRGCGHFVPAVRTDGALLPCRRLERLV